MLQSDKMAHLAPLMERVVEGYLLLPDKPVEETQLSIYIVESASRELASSLPDRNFVMRAVRLARRELSDLPEFAALCDTIETQLARGACGYDTARAAEFHPASAAIN